MNLPNLDRVVIEKGKIVDYLLAPLHPRGAGKERFFRGHGFRIDEWQLLAAALLQHARTCEVVREVETGFGPRYLVEGALSAPDGRRPLIRSVWQFDHGAVAPRLITAYPLESI